MFSTPTQPVRPLDAPISAGPAGQAVSSAVTAMAARKRPPRDLNIVKKIDAASPLLMI